MDTNKRREVTRLCVVKKTLRTLIRKNKMLRQGLARKVKQIQMLNRRIKELSNGQEVKAKNVQEKDLDFSERKHPSLIFPEEVWRMIIENVTTPQDLWACSNTCELFADILSQWRSEWMFEKALPHLYGHLPRNKLLECRLVCTGWNKKITNFLEDHPSLRTHDSKRDPRMLEFVNPVLEKDLGNRNTFNFWNLDCNPNLPMTFNGNPFMGRYVTLMMRRGFENKPTVETVQKFYDKVHTFLKLYGKEILYLNLFFNGHTRSHREELEITKFAKKVIIDAIQLIPNLRKLRLRGPDYYERQEKIHLPGSLPAAPNLDSLEIDEFFNEHQDDTITRAMLVRYHGQLRKLHAAAEDWNEQVGNLEWPLLTELNLKIGRSIKNLNGEKMPGLTKLGVHAEPYLNFDLLLTLIWKLSSTTRLNTLRLNRLSGLDYDLEDPKRRSRWTAPPSIETLELDNFLVASSQSSYTFLLLQCFPHLKNLHIFLRSDPWKFQSEVQLMDQVECDGQVAIARRNEKGDEVVRVNKYLGSGGNMYKSNIWELLPRLNVFSFQLNVYTRDGYKKYLRKRNLQRQKNIVTD